jgi:hypothetical protein
MIALAFFENSNEEVQKMGTRTAKTLRGRGICCDRCGAFISEPQWSDLFREEGVILDLWACTQCGHRFETEVAADRWTNFGDAGSKISSPIWMGQRAPLGNRTSTHERVTSS